VWADENQIVRVAFIDSNDDIVQVELSGKGELAIEFEEGAYSPPRSPGFQPSEDWGLSGHWTSKSLWVWIRHLQLRKKEQSALWIPEIPEEGNYDVYYWIPNGSASRATNAKYTLVHAEGETTYLVDQSVVPGGGWRKLGTHRFVKGSVGYAMLNNKANGKHVSADAIKFTKVAE